MKTYPEKKERIYLKVAVDIWHDSKAERAFAISAAKEDLICMGSCGLAEPVSVKLITKNK